MSALIGRIRIRPDENVRLNRPVDDNRDVSRLHAGRKVRIACALGGALVCGLVIPATARAADPFGTAQLVQEVDTAVAQATGTAPQASVPTAAAPVDASKTVDAATKTLEVATKQAAVVASSAIAEAQSAAQSAAVGSVPGMAGAPARAPAKTSHRRTAGHRHRAAGHSSAAQSSLRPGSGLLASTERDATALLASPSTAPAGRPQNSGAPASRATPRPTRPSLPERPPPLPRTPQPGPGAALSGQAGGQGPLTPLVVGALAAVLLMMTFEFLPRALPPKAFRKPRLIALTPWHPG